MNFKKILGAAVASAMALSTMAVAANAATAGLTYQTNVYGFRDSLGQSKGIWWDEFDEAQNNETANFTDVEITGDGQYTVSFEKSNEEESTAWNMLKIQTDIVAADHPDVTITLDKVVIGGEEKTIGEYTNNATEDLDPVKYGDGCHGFTDKIVGVYTISIINTYGENPVAAEYADKVEVTFTVSGLGAASTEGTEGSEGSEGSEGTEGGNGNTEAPTEGDKTTPDTGVEGVAVVAGIAVLAAGAIVVAKKRK